MHKRYLLLDPNPIVFGGGGEAPPLPKPVSNAEQSPAEQSPADDAVTIEDFDNASENNPIPPKPPVTATESNSEARKTERASAESEDTNGGDKTVVRASDNGASGRTEKASGASALATPKLGEQIKVGERDYTGYTQEEVRVLKQMSKPSFEYTAKLIKANKELSEKASSLYLQHESAFVLDPEFQEAQQDLQYLNLEAKIIQAELMKIKRGQEWQPLEGFKKDGTPVYGNPQTPTDEAEEDLRSKLHTLTVATTQKSTSVHSLKASYADRVKSDTDAMLQLQAQKFSWVANPELEKTVINVQGLGDRSLGQIKADFMSLLPSYHRANPLAGVAANLFTAMNIFANKLQQFEAFHNQQLEGKKEAALSEPSGRGSKVRANDEGDLVTLEDFS